MTSGLAVAVPRVAVTTNFPHNCLYSTQNLSIRELEVAMLPKVPGLEQVYTLKITMHIFKVSFELCVTIPQPSVFIWRSLACFHGRTERDCVDTRGRNVLKFAAQLGSVFRYWLSRTTSRATVGNEPHMCEINPEITVLYLEDSYTSVHTHLCVVVLLVQYLDPSQHADCSDFGADTNHYAKLKRLRISLSPRRFAPVEPRPLNTSSTKDRFSPAP